MMPLLMALISNASPRIAYASDLYKTEFVKWMEHLHLSELSFRTLIPEICPAKFLGDHGCRCAARVLMPVINGFTSLSRCFYGNQLMNDHNDFAGTTAEAEFEGDCPGFYLFNFGETHCSPLAEFAPMEALE